MIPVDSNPFNEIKVLNVYWDSFPKGAHIEILKTIDIGVCVKTLPFIIPDGRKTFKIPLPIEVKAAPYTDKISFVETPYLEFERMAIDNGEYVYRKIK